MLRETRERATRSWGYWRRLPAELKPPVDILSLSVNRSRDFRKNCHGIAEDNACNPLRRPFDMVTTA